jgi:hypothetical protein
MQVGFTSAQAKIMAAIAEAESGGNTAAVGDVGLVNGTWGPSVGLTQVRTLKAQTGTGGVRDINTLTDPLGNLKAAFDISNHGTDWQPWSTYNSGAYKQYLGNSVTTGTPTSAQNAGWTDTLKSGIDKGAQVLVPGYAQGEQAVQGAQSLTTMLTDKSFWLRVGFVGMGLVIILIAVNKSIAPDVVPPSSPMGEMGQAGVAAAKAAPKVPIAE